MMFWGIAFNHKSCPHWPSLKAKQEIPVHLRHPLSLASDAKPSVVGLGLVSAICKLLLGEVSLGQAGSDVSVSYASSNGDRRTVSSSEDSSGTRFWCETQGTHALTLVAVAESVLTNTRPDIALYWRQLLQTLYLATNAPPPYTSTQLLQASRDDLCNNAMMILTDTVYRTVAAACKAGELEESSDSSDTYPPVSIQTLYVQDTLSIEEVASCESVKACLVALVKQGGTALLLGPTGSLKTETAKAACLEAGVALVVIKGRVGIEDRDFYGNVYPFGKSVKFVDGPLTRAFRSAQGRKTVLLVDELLRLESHYLNAFIGVLDSYTPEEMWAMGVSPCNAERHYILELPTGESVAAPCSQLSVLATSNLGSDYLQAQTIDAALLGRFELHLDMAYLDGQELQAFYEAQTGDAHLSRALVTLELFTRDNTTDTHGLLARPANSRVVLSAASEYERQRLRGATKQEALMRAVKLTLIPFCVPRTSSGRLEESAELRLRLEVEKVSRTL
jgi:MoxR-like ATPase